MSTTSVASRSPIVAVVAAAVASVLLAGRGLLLPAGTAIAPVRVGAAVVGLGALAALVRRRGPLDAGATLAVVAVAAVVVGVATIPWSPVTVRSPADLDAGAARPTDDDPGTVVLDRVDPSAPVGPSLVLPPGVAVGIEDGRVVLRRDGGDPIVLGDAVRPPGPAGQGGAGAPTGDASGAAAPPAQVTVTDGVVTRSDGAALGAGTPLGGTALVHPGGGGVFVADGVLLPLPAPGAEGDDGLSDTEGDLVAAVLLLVFAIVAFAPPVVRVAERVAAAELAVADEAPPSEPAPRPSVEAGLSDVLGSMLADPDPRTAVIGAYARLLTALASVGFPRRAEETPHEHLWRSLGPLGVRRGPVHRLAELFVRARFTPHPVTETHRQAAISALADTIADLSLHDRDVEAALAGTGAGGGHGGG